MAGACAYAPAAPMLATGGTRLPVPTSGSNDCAKAGSAITLARVARLRSFLIAFSAFAGAGARPRVFLSPSIAFFEFVFGDDRRVAPT